MSTRKIVTVVFCDVVDSTRRAELLDPEQVRATMDRYYVVARDVLEGHGGNVEKFIGDAVMAVFGMPTVHEDDALRALRASTELLAAVGGVTYDLPSGEKLPVEVRIGVNSGEVVAADDGAEGALVTGDAVNVAARLQQAAPPGEVLVGEQTRRLARGAATFESAEAVSAKGKTEPVGAYRLVNVSPADEREAPVSRLVGRAGQLRQLRALLGEVEETRTPQLITVVGSAGVGKSRLVAELLVEVEGRAQVLRGRCLPYGNGVTYFPLTQLVKNAASITDEDDRAEARRKLDGLAGSDAEAGEVSRVIASAIGVDTAPVHADDILWATRRMLESQAAAGPLVVVFEDIHWAEPAFLDLMEYLGEFIADAAVLLVCLARPELFERRPAWGRSSARSSVMTLDSLSGQATIELFDQLEGNEAVPTALRQGILDAAEGNPLYVEEMLAMLIDDGYLVRDGSGWHAQGDSADITVPPTIGALLAARIDSLPAQEREVAERASVIGRVFEASAVRELVGAGVSEDVGRNLLALVRKEFIRPDKAELSIGDAYKFRHILLRDAAYRALPKSDRARLHEAFANWLERAAGDRISEYGEIVGYHLEQAHAYRIELGQHDEHSADLARRASTWLAAASDRAQDRGDVTGRVALAERALQLTPSADERYARLLIALAEGLSDAGSKRRAIALLDEAVAAEGSTPVTRAMARINHVFLRDDVELVTIEELREVMADTIRQLLRAGERRKVVGAYIGLAGAYQNSGHTDQAEHYYLKAANLSERWVLPEREATALVSLGGLAARSDVPVGEAVAICERVLSLPRLDRSTAGYAHETMSYLEAMRGNFGQAHAHINLTESMVREMGRFGSLGQIALSRGVVYRLTGDFERAAASFELAYDEQEKESGEFGGPAPFTGARLAQAYLDAGRVSDARRVIEQVRDTFHPGDGWTRTVFGGTEARLLAAEGRAGQGLVLAREVIEEGRADGLDRLVMLFANALEDLAACAQAAGEVEEAKAVRSEALTMYERKGATALADRLRPLM